MSSADELSTGGGRKFADLEVAEGDWEAVVLEDDGGVVHSGEAGVDLELAVCDELLEGGTVAIELEHLDAVEPVLTVGAADEDAGGVPLAYRVDRFGLVGGSGGGDEVVERGDRTIAVFASLGVWVEGVVEDLILVADRGARALFEVQVDEVEDAAIRAGGNAEVGGEFVVGVGPGCHDIAGIAAFLASGVGDAEGSVLDLPAGGRKRAAALADPTGGGAAVPEETPAGGLFLR